MINICVYVISTLFTYIMGVLSKKYNWQQELPIPVQNILIGLFVLGIAIVYTHFTKGEFNIEQIIEQIISALGGSGTATLYYDNIKIRKEEE